MTNITPLTALLYEHEDGRYAVNPDTTGDPGWHRLGPVDLGALAAQDQEAEPALPLALKTHGAWDGLEGLDDLPDGTEIYAGRPPRSQADAPAAPAVAPLSAVLEQIAQGWDGCMGGEPIPLRIVHDDVLFKLQSDTEAAAPAQAAPAAVAGPSDDMFELWWAEHMPKATQSKAWAAWIDATRAAPALGAPAAQSQDEAAFEKWFRGEQGKPYQGMWEFARAAWMARAAAAAQAAPAAPAGFPHDAIGMMAIERYKVASSDNSMFHRYAVVAGDGAMQLYLGREVECANMARRFAGAFQDGAYAYHRMLAAAPQAPAAPVVQLHPARAGRIYVAGPMTGLPEFNFPAFNRAADGLRAAGWHVENPAEHGIVDGAEWADYLHYDLWRLSTCSAVHLLPGWSKSRGAALEVHVATTLGMAIFYADDAERVDQAAPAAPAVDALAERDAAFEAVRNWLCGLQRYSFVLDDDGVVRRTQDRTGNWIEFDAAHELFDPVAVDAAIAAQAKEGGESA